MQANYKGKIRAFTAAVTLSAAIAVSANAATTDEIDLSPSADLSQNLPEAVQQTASNPETNSYTVSVSNTINTINQQKQKNDRTLFHVLSDATPITDELKRQKTEPTAPGTEFSNQIHVPLSGAHSLPRYAEGETQQAATDTNTATDDSILTTALPILGTATVAGTTLAVGAGAAALAGTTAAVTALTAPVALTALAAGNTLATSAVAATPLLATIPAAVAAAVPAVAAAAALPLGTAEAGITTAAATIGTGLLAGASALGLSKLAVDALALGSAAVTTLASAAALGNGILGTAAAVGTTLLGATILTPLVTLGTGAVLSALGLSALETGIVGLAQLAVTTLNTLAVGNLTAFNLAATAAVPTVLIVSGLVIAGLTAATVTNAAILTSLIAATVIGGLIFAGLTATVITGIGLAVSTALILGLTALTIFNLLALGAAAFLGLIFAEQLFTVLMLTPILLGTFTLGTLAQILGLGALLRLGARVTLLGFIGLQALLGAGLSAGLLGLGTLAAVLAPIITFFAIRLIAPIVGLIQWEILGHAWGNFIGAVLGGLNGFLIGGLIGFLIAPPGTKLLFMQWWQLLCLPLWNFLGQFVGNLICTPIGAGLGLAIGTLFPKWTLTLGMMILPFFTALWETLAVAINLFTHGGALLIQWIPRYILRNLHMMLTTFIPGGLRSLFNILTFRYGPLLNRIFLMTSFSDSVDSGWGSLGYFLYGRTDAAMVPVLDSAPQLVARALGAIDNQFSLPGARSNEIRFLVDPFYFGDLTMWKTDWEMSNGGINPLKLIVGKLLARLSVRFSQVITINIGSNDLWMPFMSAVYNIIDDGRLPLDFTSTTTRSELFGMLPAVLYNVFCYCNAWVKAPLEKKAFYAFTLVDGARKELDYFINMPLILLHIFLLNPFATVVVEGMESPVRNWDLLPGLDDNLIEYMMAPLYEVYNAYKKLLVLLYPGHAVYADMSGIQLYTEKYAIPLFENLTMNRSGFDPHPSFIGRRQQADRILRALGQPSPYGVYELPYLVPSFYWNVIYPYSPVTLLNPLATRIHPLDIFPV